MVEGFEGSSSGMMTWASFSSAATGKAGISAQSQNLRVSVDRIKGDMIGLRLSNFQCFLGV